MSFGPDFGPGRLGAPSAGWHPAAAQTETAQLHAPAADDHGLTNNPLLVYGALAGIVFGLMAFSTSVRVGKTTASVSIGDSK
jgi:hypothetical protein